MRKIFFINSFIILCFNLQEAAAIPVDYSGPYDNNIIKLNNNLNSTQIFVINYKKKLFLVYKSNYRYQNRDSISTLAESPDLIDIGFSCGKKTEDLNFCNRFFNRRTDQMSPIFSNVIDHNNQQIIVAYQIKSKDLVVVTPIFQKCPNPLTYKINLYPNTDFGIKTKFLNNGNLQLDYVNLKNEDVIKVIPIDYQQLYKNCGLQLPHHAGTDSLFLDQR